MNYLVKEIEEELKKVEKGLGIDQELVLSKKAQLAAVESEVKRRTELLNPLEKQLLYTKLVSKELKKQNEKRQSNNRNPYRNLLITIKCVSSTWR